MGLNVLIGFAVCAGGVAKSLEKVTKVMMLGLLFLIVILAGNSLLLPGAEEGLRFYLLPDWDRAAAAGLGNVASAAMFQAFFTLSVGQGSMEIFASYMSKDNSLTGEAVRITILDTFVAIMAGSSFSLPALPSASLRRKDRPLFSWRCRIFSSICRWDSSGAGSSSCS